MNENIRDNNRGVTSHGVRTGYDRALIEIKDGVLRMGALVEEQVRAALESLGNHDSRAASGVIEEDRRINELQQKTTALIAGAIATQNPVARDLRYLLTLDHVSYELERMGDHAASVAKQSQRLAPLATLPEVARVTELGLMVADLVRGVTHALVDVDERAARQVAARDDEVDNRYRKLFESLLKTMRDDSSKVDAGTAILFAAHYLERIGDRVTNIAEDIVFLASGEVEDLNPQF